METKGRILFTWKTKGKRTKEGHTRWVNGPEFGQILLIMVLTEFMGLF